MKLFSSFKRLKSGLKKSSESIASSLKQAIGLNGTKLDADTLDTLETALLQADVGLDATERLLKELQQQNFAPETTTAELEKTLAELIGATLAPLETTAHEAFVSAAKENLQILLMVGVNGGGKTTTTAKLAEFYQAQGLKVTLAAADTFRAGAVAQLSTWAERTKTPLINPEDTNTTDPAALAYTAITAAEENGSDVLIIDTAGRLSNRQDLMDELAKINRTVHKKVAPEHIHTVLVLDGTVGQNALSQLEAFKSATSISGLVVTKLDSAAKGGILLALTAKNAPPVWFITTGETVADLHPFNAENYAKALLNIS